MSFVRPWKSVCLVSCAVKEPGQSSAVPTMDGVHFWARKINRSLQWRICQPSLYDTFQISFCKIYLWNDFITALERLEHLVTSGGEFVCFYWILVLYLWLCSSLQLFLFFLHWVLGWHFSVLFWETSIFWTLLLFGDSSIHYKTCIKTTTASFFCCLRLKK